MSSLLLRVAEVLRLYRRYGFRCHLQQLSGRLLDAHVLSTCRSGSLAPSYSLHTYHGVRCLDVAADASTLGDGVARSADASTLGDARRRYLGDVGE